MITWYEGEWNADWYCDVVECVEMLNSADLACLTHLLVFLKYEIFR